MFINQSYDRSSCTRRETIKSNEVGCANYISKNYFPTFDMVWRTTSIEKRESKFV